VRRAAALLLLAAAACRRGPAAPEAKPSAPDQVIAQFTMDNFQQGAREWTLEAPRAFVFEAEKRVEVEKPHIRFYDKGRPGASLDAGRGRFFTDRRDLRAWDGVVMVSTDGARLESPWMDYDADKDLVTSTAPVTVTRQRSVLRGVGWEAKPDLSKVVVKRQTLEYREPLK
jgi:LPS export ABC transporter protein LptC